jgi:hypothetical protein
MEVSGQLHAPAALSPEIDSAVLTVYEAERETVSLQKRKIPSLVGIEPKFLGFTARSLLITRLSYPGYVQQREAITVMLDLRF